MYFNTNRFKNNNGWASMIAIFLDFLAKIADIKMSLALSRDWRSADNQSNAWISRINYDDAPCPWTRRRHFLSQELVGFASDIFSWYAVITVQTLSIHWKSLSRDIEVCDVIYFKWNHRPGTPIAPCWGRTFDRLAFHLHVLCILTKTCFWYEKLQPRHRPPIVEIMSRCKGMFLDIFIMKS